MNYMALLKSESLAWAFGVIATMALATLAFSFIGWLGIGMVGLIGLIVTTQNELFGGSGASHDHHSVSLYAREQQRAQDSQEQALAEAAKRIKNKRVHYAVNTGLIAMTAFGFGLFFLHQI